jgi:hypothetical protein
MNAINFESALWNINLAKDITGIIGGGIMVLAQGHIGDPDITITTTTECVVIPTSTIGGNLCDAV